MCRLELKPTSLPARYSFPLCPSSLGRESMFPPSVFTAVCLCPFNGKSKLPSTRLQNVQKERKRKNFFFSRKASPSFFTLLTTPIQLVGGKLTGFPLPFSVPFLFSFSPPCDEKKIENFSL
ncbi:hypothetical protein, unlikely [Trypanosoma brucei gambiense DAL972]|uniref:Uncharacterized protein n=1 Tax=Trypanosoma brucei gambiense (strain MHOM/CI/86/DAL972) TaxID=679716 RepID=C9ZSZ4_TRYB9|nr:hypothetical protein, unlikely [Trypanosoma brucei gambiense DAL972]CBH12529.1 hypothetical protein, unlikely [Trypanosoma brucei gambiense DAL972]|eukprot:XP_011774809.1 hypothetical protein, unlikely [Trypanosoma brucei gambiense DAL972]